MAAAALPGTGLASTGSHVQRVRTPAYSTWATKLEPLQGPSRGAPPTARGRPKERGGAPSGKCHKGMEQVSCSWQRQAGGAPGSSSSQTVRGSTGSAKTPGFPALASAHWWCGADQVCGRLGALRPTQVATSLPNHWRYISCSHRWCWCGSGTRPAPARQSAPPRCAGSRGRCRGWGRAHQQR